MRSEEDMLDLIINTAREDTSIRAVVMNGSRVNPDAPKDIFQDFDVVFFSLPIPLPLYEILIGSGDLES